MASSTPWIVLHEATMPDGAHHVLKALVRPHRVTVRMNESTVRGIMRVDIVPITPDAMDKLVAEWQRVRTLKEASE